MEDVKTADNPFIENSTHSLGLLGATVSAEEWERGGLAYLKEIRLAEIERRILEIEERLREMGA